MRTVLITGASRGIGRAIAENLGRDSHILVGSTTQEGADAVVKTLPSAERFVVDLTDPDAVEAAVAKLDRVDAVVHSAGMLELAPIAEVTWKQWQDSFGLNLFAVAGLTKHLLPKLREARGTVVTINSGSGFHSGPNQALYSGTKYALRAFTDALRAEEAGHIRVTSVHPGRVNTEMQQALRRAEGHADEDYDGSQWAQPASIADTVRTVLDLGEDATVPEIRVNPSGLA